MSRTLLPKNKEISKTPGLLLVEEQTTITVTRYPSVVYRLQF